MPDAQDFSATPWDVGGDDGDYGAPAGRELWESRRQPVDDPPQDPGHEVLDVDAVESPADVDPLESLRWASKIRIIRTKPLDCKGFCCTMELEDGQVPDIDAIERSYGGGTYLLRPLRQASNGSWVYAQRSETIQIVGEPLVKGRPYTDRASPFGGGPLAVQNPAQLGRPADAMYQMMQHMFGSLVEGMRTDLHAVREEVSSLRNGGGQADPLGGVNQVLGIMRALRQFDRPDPRDFDDDDGDDGDDETQPPAMGSREQMEGMFQSLAMGWLKDKANGTAQPAAPQPPTQPQPQPRLIRKNEAPAADAAPDLPPPPPPPPPPPEITGESIAEFLKRLEPSSAARVVQELMLAMPPQQMQEIISRVGTTSTDAI